MLMQKIEAAAPVRKTAKELGITAKQYKALIWVQQGLLSGKFEHVLLESTHTRWVVEYKDDNGFNMGEWDCGTCRCIGGWMDYHLEGDDSVSRHSKSTAVLDDLFFPLNTLLAVELSYHTLVQSTYDSITNAHAAQAIENFLLTGDPQWKKVMGREQTT